MIARWVANTRARQWLHFLALPLAGVARARGVADGASRALGALVACAAVLSFGYLLNAITDRAMDLDARKNPLVVEGARSFAAPLWLLAAVALGAAASVSTEALLAAAAALTSGWCYSAGPRLKAAPFVGTALNAGNFAPLLLLGARGAAEVRALLPLVAAFIALLLQNQLLHEAADADEDRRGRLRTTFATIGPRWSAAVAMVCGLAICAVAAGRVPSWALAVCATGALFAPASLLRLRDARGAAAARRRHRFVSLAVGAALFASGLASGSGVPLAGPTD